VNELLLAVRLALAVVLAVAAGAKLADLMGFRLALLDFAVPPRLLAPLAVALPLAELCVALALLPATSARGGAVAALALLVAFSAGIAVNLARGRTADCHCFGVLHAMPAGRGVLARNAVLAGLAALVAVAGPGPSAVAWLGRLSLAEALALAALLVATLALAAAGAALWRVLPLKRAPDFAPDEPVLLLFTSSGCRACDELLPEVARWPVTVVADGDEREAARLASRYGLDRVLADPGRRLGAAYGVDGTPYAVLLGATGCVAATAAGPAEIRALVREPAVEELLGRSS
jgi:hypothetical protein